ncbi:MAG: hypothetical protein MUF38_07535 [Anaerolineae bacterium]|jgi:hypothetical protein|nr:hypothetical protein [Anaerolineae bacterium]
MNDVQSKAAREYSQRFSLAMIMYAVTLVIAILIINRLDEDNTLRYLIALLPVIPVLFGFRAFMTFLRQMDELQRQINFEGFAFSLGLTGIITFTLGFLEMAGLELVGMIWVFPLSIALWGIGAAIARRRYE